MHCSKGAYFRVFIIFKLSQLCATSVCRSYGFARFLYFPTLVPSVTLRASDLFHRWFLVIFKGRRIDLTFEEDRLIVKTTVESDFLHAKSAKDT